MEDPRKALEALIERAGLSVTSSFIPLSKSRNAKPGADGKIWESLNWKVRLERAGRVIIETDYSQGSAHCPAYKKAWLNGDKKTPNKWGKARAIAQECENGRIAKPDFYGEPGFHTLGVIPGPNTVDVLSSLCLDSSVLDYAGFEDWAAEYGYEADSRAAEKVYQDCLAIALKIRAALGEALLSEARDLSCQL
jgi:hypothetical protein